MIAVFNGVTIGDDIGSLKGRMKMEQLGLSAVEQVESLAFAVAKFRAMRGNAAGDCVFTVRKSHATRDAAGTYFKAEVLRINTQASLVLTLDAVTLTMANATCRSVMVTEFNGVEWTLRYTFGITTIT